MEFASYADLALWLSIHVGLYIHVSRYVLPEECEKVDQEAVKAEKKKDEKKKKTKEGDGKKEEKGKGNTLARITQCKKERKRNFLCSFLKKYSSCSLIEEKEKEKKRKEKRRKDRIFAKNAKLQQWEPRLLR